MSQLVDSLIPDLTSYTNLWLAITCFGVRSNINAPIEEDEPFEDNDEN
jgi:hypothetical protein